MLGTVCIYAYSYRRAVGVVVSTGTGLWVGLSNFDSWLGQEIFSAARCPDFLWGPSKFIYIGCLHCSFTWAKVAAVWSWRLSGIYSQMWEWVELTSAPHTCLMACTGVALPLPWMLPFTGTKDFDIFLHGQHRKVNICTEPLHTVQRSETVYKADGWVQESWLCYVGFAKMLQLVKVFWHKGWSPSGFTCIK